MDCPAALERLNARLDGEQSPEVEAPLAAHLESCADCRALFEQLQAVDSLLRQELSNDPAVERVFRSTQAQPAPMKAVPIAAPPDRNSRLLAAVVAMTAMGIALAVLLREPGDRRRPVAADAHEMRITLARGTVNVRASTLMDWQPISLPRDAAQPIGSQLRTEAGSQCEFRCPSGGVVRVDEQTELELTKAAQLSITAGRIWCTAAPRSPLTVVASLTSEPRPLTVFSCPSDSSLQADVKSPDSARVVAVRGPVQVERGAMLVRVEADQFVSCSPTGMADPVRADVRQETEWMLPLLALRGGNDVEFGGEVTGLLARIGDSKASYVHESRLVELGAPGAVPLIAYLRETRGAPSLRQRFAAARVIQETAGPDSAPELVPLLDDSVPEVRIAAAAALERVSGIDHGVPSAEWRDFGDRQREAITRWRSWLNNRK